MGTYEKILKYREGNNEDLEKIIEMFYHIINKYSKLLNQEDTKQDLIIYLIEVLNKISIKNNSFYNDKIIFSYIVKCIKTKYIYLSRKNSKKLLNESNFDIEWELGEESFESELVDLFKILTEKESFIIKAIYVYYLSITEIADYMNISRQAVNQSKNRALKKLRKLYLE